MSRDWMRAMRRALPLLVVVLLAACAGDDGGSDTTNEPVAVETTQPGPVQQAEMQTTPFPQAGQTLVQFVRAAEKLDVTRMWGLLTSESRVGLGPTLGDFESGTAQELSQGLGALARGKGFEVILSEKVEDKYAVAAVASEAALQGGKHEYFAYGAALKPENGIWKISLGSVRLFGLKPVPVSNAKPMPTVEVSIQALLALTHAGVWVDAQPIKESGTIDQEGNVTLTGKPPAALKAGRHTVVAFAATEQTASATAWTFKVRP